MKKLVRDKIPEIIQSQGRIAEVQIIQSDEEYFKFLNDKLSEEVDEFLKAETFDNRIEELADVLEVIDSICIFSKCIWRV